MAESTLLTEIPQQNYPSSHLNYRHREEIQAKHFDQFVFDNEDAVAVKEKSKKQPKRDRYQTSENQNKKQNKQFSYDEIEESFSENSDDSSDSNSDCSSECSDASSIPSNSDSEEHDVWDNTQFDIHGLDLDNLKFCKNDQQSFFTLYKLRYCQIRDVMTKKLTQKQHQEININILKIVKSLSQNKIQSIQCHNYNYFQSLTDLPQFKRFQQYLQDSNLNSRKLNQSKQKQEFLDNIAAKRKQSCVNNVPIAFPGIKTVMNRASFSSAKDGSPSQYLISQEKNKLSTNKNGYDSSYTTQDTIYSSTKRTLKDFDIDNEYQQSSPFQSVTQFNGNNNSNNQKNSNAEELESDKIGSLHHIADYHSEYQSVKQSLPSTTAINFTPSKKFKISISTIKTNLKKQGSLTENNSSSQNNLQVSQPQSQIPSLIFSSAVTPKSNQTNNSKLNAFGNVCQIIEDQQNQIKTNDANNNNLSLNKKDNLHYIKPSTFTDFSSPLQIKKVQANSSKLLPNLNSQSLMNTNVQREMNSIYYSSKGFGESQAYMNQKPQTSYSQTRNKNILLHIKTNPNIDQDKQLPNLKEEQQNQIKNNKQIPSTQTISIQNRSTSNHVKYTNKTDQNDTQNSFTGVSPLFYLNKSSQASPAPQIPKNTSSRLFFLEKKNIYQGNNCSINNLMEKEENLSNEENQNKGNITPNHLTINKNNASKLALRQQRIIYSNQSYSTLIQKQENDQIDQQQKSAQEYLLTQKMNVPQINGLSSFHYNNSSYSNRSPTTATNANNSNNYHHHQILLSAKINKNQGITKDQSQYNQSKPSSSIFLNNNQQNNDKQSFKKMSVISQSQQSSSTSQQSQYSLPFASQTYQNTFFKNQYIQTNGTNTTNQLLIQSFKQIAQN